MYKFDKKFYLESWRRYKTTYLVSNDVLYEMCRKYPDHNDWQQVLAKVSIIDLVYGANFARYDRENAIKLARYICLHTSVINKLFRRLDRAQNSRRDFVSKLCEVVSVHGEFTKLIRDCTATNAPVFASKYLHFHFPKIVPILDSRAEHAIKQHRKCKGGNFSESGCQLKRGKENKRYIDFCDKFLDLLDCVKNDPDENFLIKKLDQYLYQYQKGYKPPKRSVSLRGNYF